MIDKLVLEGYLYYEDDYEYNGYRVPSDPKDIEEVVRGIISEAKDFDKEISNG